MTNSSTTEIPELIDPEPISFSLSIFAALTAAAGVIIQITDSNRKRIQDKSAIRKHIYNADRSLNRLDEAYRNLISVYDEQNILGSPIVLGRNPLFVDERLKIELERLHSNIFYGGRDLQDALIELSGLLDQKDSQSTIGLAADLDGIFQSAWHAKNFLEFMIELGQMLNLITDFINGIGKKFNFIPTSRRDSLLRDTIEQLRSRRNKMD